MGSRSRARGGTPKGPVRLGPRSGHGTPLTSLRKNRKYGSMKTTLNIRDDVVRRAKARAALAGKSLSRFVEDSLARIIDEEEPDTSSWCDWAASLPDVPRAAAAELSEEFASAGFRPIEPEMWQ